MSVRQSEQIHSGTSRDVKSRIFRLLLLLPILATGLSYFGVFSPILSPLVYPKLAPPGWHNITPHGKIVLFDFAASAETPSLMLACGSAFNITVTDPTTWIPGRFHFWRTRDGGAHWELLHPPFGDGERCGVSIHAGEHESIIAIMDSSSDPTSSTNVTTTWLSHDEGTTWRRITYTNVNSYGLGADYRHGLLYSYGSPDDSTNNTLAVSANDGVTWTPIPSMPSKLQQQGWQIDYDSSPPEPDYGEDQGWYRVLSLRGQPPMLEHSADDGRTWALVGAIGTEPMQSVLLASTPLLPGHLCAAHLSGKTNHVSIFSSADGGQTWQTGAIPANLVNTTGETGFSLQIGANGDCYQGYHYHRPQAPENENDYVYLRLAPQSSTLQEIPLGNNQNIASTDTMYVPAGNGMGARLIVNSELPPSSGAAVFSDLATETDQGQLLWAAVP